MDIALTRWTTKGKNILYTRISWYSLQKSSRMNLTKFVVRTDLFGQWLSTFTKIAKFLSLLNSQTKLNL